MKSLIIEDETLHRLLLTEILRPYGPCHVASNGKEGIEAFLKALDKGSPYQLICIDIVMPKMNGHETLHFIREEEKKRSIYVWDKAKIIIITALTQLDQIKKAYEELCDAYLTKPVHRDKLEEELRKLNLLE